MANTYDRVTNTSIFDKICARLEKEHYYGYLTETHYHPSSPSHRAEASKAFMAWFLENYSDIDFTNDDVKKYIIDASGDQGIDAIVPTSKKGSQNRCDDINFYQAKFYEVEVDDDAVMEMRTLYNRVKRGRIAFSSEIQYKLNCLNVFDYLNKAGVKIHFVLVTSTHLSADASREWARLKNDIENDYYLNADLLLYDDEYFKKIL